MKNVIVIILSIILITSSSTLALAPVFAKDLNLPSGADRVIYYDGAGQADIPLPTVPSGFPPTATAIRFTFSHVKIPNADVDFSSLVIWVYMKPVLRPLSWQPYAVITTSSDDATFERILWYGTYAKWNATLWGVPSWGDTDNVIVVSNDVLMVKRHGNDISVELNQQQQVKRVNTVSTYFTVPAFSLTLNNYGDATVATTPHTWTGYPGSSNYTMLQREVSFNANGAITSSGSYLDAKPVENATIVMSGIDTFFPPP